MSYIQQPDEKIEANKEFFVVGIGASAGGLSALEDLFEHLPVDSGAAFVVIQHLSPDFKSLMKELLERRTKMAVYRVTEGMKLQPNSVYLIPPDRNLVVDADLLRLEERKKDKNNKRELNFPIDLFFQSLAKNHGENAIGVILSGSGSDGTRGLRAINEAGGVALVQTPETAEFDGMPRSAIATGVANQVLPPRELAQLIYQCIVLPLNSSEAEFSNNSSLDSSSLKDITNLLIESQNLDFSHYKTTTISRRIHRRRLINNLENVINYIELLKTSPDERQILCSDLLINVTHFFRNKQAWEKLDNNVLPLLIEQAKPDEELRFWVTACSTGEEAYSLAILVNEALIDSGKKLRVKIFATDIDRIALEKASLGIYPQSIANDIGTELLHKYFITKDDGYQVMRKLREMMIFSPHDLTKDAVFTRMHLITCRNVLIYMQPELQHYVLGNLHFSLIVKGVLFLGEAESVSVLESEFKTLDSKWKIYQKQRSVRLPMLPKANPRTSVRSLLQSSFTSSQKIRNESIREQSLKRLLEESNSLMLLVSQDNRLLHVCGDGVKIFKAPDGDFGNEVTQMVVPSLQLPLNIALHRVKKEKKSVLYTGIKIENGDEVYHINLKVIPPKSEDTSSHFNLVQIDYCSVSQPQEIYRSEQFEVGNEAQRRFVELEQELQQTRENLQALVEELETTNEEQQASNEELTASNEELQSTNEELHSVNEELHTVNVEYQGKILQLTELNNDIDNLLKSTNIGVIFLDRKLKIRKFTPAATEAISLRQADIDRPIEDLSYKIECPNLVQLLQGVLNNKQPAEQEVKLKQKDGYFLMRINPYQTEDGQDEGIVISFIKIDEIKQVQGQLEQTLTTLRSRETELNQLNHQLEKRVAERTANLADFSDRLKQLHRLATTYHERIEDLFADYIQMGCKMFDLSTGIVSKVVDCTYTIVAIQSPLNLSVGFKTNCEDTYCAMALEQEKTVSFSHIGAIEGMKQHPIYQNFHLESFIGTPIFVNGVIYGTLNFCDPNSREQGFESYEREIIELMARDIGQSLAAWQTQGDLQKSEKRFRSNFEQAAVGIAYVSLEGHFIEVNQRLCEILGYQSDLLLELTLQNITHPEDLGKDSEDIRQLLAGERENYAMEKRYIRCNGSIVWINLTVSMVKDDSGKPEYFISVIEDIGDRKQTELDLEESRQQLERASLAKDSFIAHMSHELRTPLNSIIGFSHILLQNPSSIEQQLRDINIINQSGQHLLTLINDILDFSKIEAGKLQLEAQNLNLIDFLGDIIDIFQFSAEQKGLSFETQIADSLPIAVKTDETRLRQVLLNLLSNAIKFTEAGSVTFSVVCIEDFVKDKWHKICFQVADTGIGIPEDKLGDIFIPFQQLDTQLHNQEGTGLGLTITQNILQLMDSKIQLSSNLGEGSRFWFDLELMEIDEPNSYTPRKLETETKTIRHLKQPCKVLIVDDNADNRNLLICYLQPLGFITEEAENGAVCLTKLAIFQPDVILLDLMMPVMDGRETIEQIRQQNKLGDTLIFMISANSESIINSQKLDCDAFIPKPIDLDNLLELLETHLQMEWTIINQVTSKKNLSAFVPPPQNELRELLELVNLGDIEAMERQIQLWEELDSQYASFVIEIRQFMASFELDKLENTIARLLETSNTL
jgi:two-component system, chemotaxis family, CheB/CheR fusion protein